MGETIGIWVLAGALMVNASVNFARLLVNLSLDGRMKEVLEMQESRKIDSV